METVAICVHGHSPEPNNNFYPPRSIWQDRLKHAVKLADMFETSDVETTIFISGGGEFDGESEAEHMHRYAKTAVPGYEEKDVKLLEKSIDTRGNVYELGDAAESINADAIVPVTSKSHGPRVLRDWSRHYSGPIPILTAATTMPHTRGGETPLVIEPKGHSYSLQLFNEVLGVVEKYVPGITRQIRNTVSWVKTKLS